MSQEEMVKEAVEEAKKAAEAEEKDKKEKEEKKIGGEGCTPESEEKVQEEDASEVEDSGEDKAEDAEESGKEKEEPKKKKFFEKKNKKDKRDEQIADLTDKLTRQMAEFDNYRKRTEKEKSAMYEIGAKDVIEKILPVVDNFERGLQSVAEENKEDPFVQGMDKIYKQLMTTLEGLEVKPIEAVGKEFDPELHNAVMHVEDEELGDNIVAEEFQKGYTYRDSVVRHSMVKVAN
ncbi:MAG: nucleotide exchange factor GrpE [Coprococcus sp.]|nr:nucleotide exchange factor GrpE [Coprococcus sp.]